ncbi:Uncharacterised protein [Staphylococcus hominis]|nr:Uncharacterised protein [Staphylococcus hominis]
MVITTQKNNVYGKIDIVFLMKFLLNGKGKRVS